MVEPLLTPDWYASQILMSNLNLAASFLGIPAKVGKNFKQQVLQEIGLALNVILNTRVSTLKDGSTIGEYKTTIRDLTNMLGLVSVGHLFNAGAMKTENVIVTMPGLEDPLRGFKHLDFMLTKVIQPLDKDSYGVEQVGIIGVRRWDKLDGPRSQILHRRRISASQIALPYPILTS